MALMGLVEEQNDTNICRKNLVTARLFCLFGGGGGDTLSFKLQQQTFVCVMERILQLTPMVNGQLVTDFVDMQD